ncbi:ComEC/Rec2 family competence protein [Staphylococcus saccharolyticus]|uniref:ComEC/Rec2 family competence protein n=1 Tax=Staphylococcus saccharolyticus TaxID=33028 RepID=UPI0020C39BE9|nr:ComEC/Rec2 family competence protein [Staphylococcus saccharolyticus]
MSAYHFNQFQWIGFLSNIFFVPYYSFILFPSVIFFFIFCHFKHHNYLLNKIMDSLFQYHDWFITKFLYFNHYKWFIPNLNEYSLLFLIVTCIFLLLIMAYKVLKIALPVFLIILLLLNSHTMQNLLYLMLIKVIVFYLRPIIIKIL